jgi:D-alanyl-D-alanine carboxypeptidase/D-alanyl-D-alanine-endopeptidase (penicillin-binding protein 4)
LAVASATVATVILSTLSPAVAGASGESASTGPQDLTTALAAIENQSRYDHSTWGYQVLDQETGQVLASQNAQSMFDPGSTMKIYSTATALRLYGPNYRFTTPAYRQGTMSGSTLNGNLVLVGSGDLSLGLRDKPNGTLFYETCPTWTKATPTSASQERLSPLETPLPG